MKKLPENRRRGTTRRIAVAVTALALVGLVAAGAATAWSRLHAMWIEQCVVTDVSSQVSVTSGKMVKGDVIAENFGLRKGANLALIDFDAKRREVLAKIPNLKSISVVKRLPDKVTIVAEERSPIVRMGIKGSRSDTGRVADAEGMVFLCSRGTRMLPVIRETAAPGSPVGKRLEGRAAAALQLLDLARDPEFQELGILEVDISKPDYVSATLGRSYSTAKIAWEGMDDPSPASRAELARRLGLLLKAIRTRIGDNAVIWNAADLANPGRIYADTKESIK